MMKMLDNGFEDKVKDRRKLKRKTLADKGLLKKRSKRQKSTENWWLKNHLQVLFS